MQHDTEEIVLENGVRGLLVNVPGAKVMSYDFNVRAGYYLAPDGKWEVPHVMEHLLCGANEEYKKSRYFDAEVKKNGAYTNAYTSTYNVGYVGECANFEWDRMLDLLMLSISKPLFLEEEFTAEMGNVKEELTGYLSNYFRQLGVGLGERLGFLAATDRKRIRNLHKITLDDIKAHYIKTHSLENMRFLIAGDIEGRANDIKRIIGRKLQLPHGERFELPVTTLYQQDQPLYIQNKTVESLYIALGIFLPERISDSEDFALDILNNILTATMNSLILGELREKGLAYYIFSSGNRGHDYSTWEFDFQVSPENALKAVRVIVKNLKKILNDGVSSEVLKAAKDYELGSFQMSGQTVGRLLSGYSQDYSVTGEVDDYYKIEDRIKAVTEKRVMAITEKFHQGKCWDFGVLGNCDQKLVDQLYAELGKLWK